MYVTPVFKNKDSTFVENYKAVSVLPTVFKIFERIMQKQITGYKEKFLSPFFVITEKDSVHSTLCYHWRKSGNYAYISKVLQGLY